jgi:hypothetical protein
MSRLVVLLAVLAVLILGFGSACGTNHGKSARSSRVNLTGTLTVVMKKNRSARRYELRIYDPAGRVAAAITGAEVVRSSVRVVRESGGRFGLFVGLTKNGASAFCSLTRALARRGARLHSRQRFAVALGSHVYARPWVDYRAFPNGLCSTPGIEWAGMPLPVARRLAARIRTG